MCTHRERLTLEIPQNAELRERLGETQVSFFKWTTEGEGESGFASIPRRRRALTARV